MLAAAAAYAIFGLSYLFSKMAMDTVPPILLLCARFTVTFLILNLLLAFRVFKLQLRGKKILGPILLGILQPVLYFLMENYGLMYTTTSFTGIVSATSPIHAAILGALLLKEKPNGKQWICIVLAISGVLMVSLGSSSGENTVLGCLCLLGAYLIGALYSVYARHLSKTFSAFEITYIMFSVGFVFYTVLAFVCYGGNTMPMLSAALVDWKFILSILYLGGVSSVGAYMLSNYSYQWLTVTRSTIFSCFATMVSVLSGVLIMGDPFTLTAGIALVLILVGVCGVNFFATKEK